MPNSDAFVYYTCIFAFLASSCSALVVEVIESNAQPVIGRTVAAAAGVQGGFETGNAVKVDGVYHLFPGERAPRTDYAWKMGWTTQIGHWVSKDGFQWHRLETVLVSEGGASCWSIMPVWNVCSDRWLLYYVDTYGSGHPRVLSARDRGMNALSSPQNWSDAGVNLTTEPTFSVSNPFVAPDGRWALLACGGSGPFEVVLAFSTSISGPFTVPQGSEAVAMIDQVNGSSWIENPALTAVTSSGETKVVAMFDWVQGGGQARGSPLPYLGFSWSPDGVVWPKENGELVSVINTTGGGWTDLVRTPTSLIDEGDGTYTCFYAARDTRKVSPPYLNCTVEPDGCFWGIGRLRVRLHLP